MKLEVKDLINIGIFTALYFVCFFATGMIGYIPIFLVLMPLVCPIVSGIPFMLYMTKIHKFGMITITSVICGLLMMLTGHPWLVMVSCIVCGVIADLILKAGKYNSWKHTVIAYAVFSEWMMGAMSALFFMRKSYLEEITAGYGETYANTIANMTPSWMFYLMILFIVVGSVMGALLGRKVLKKHFSKAGIV